MSDPRILLIDDDMTLLEILSDQLLSSGYQPVIAEDADTGLRLFIEAEPDLVILDVMMPSMDGWEVCARLRDRSSIPIIMLTAKGQEVDKLRGFRLGVDDYVTKPFSFAELIARIGAVLSRVGSSSPQKQARIGADMVIDFGQHRVMRSGEIIDLTPTEYRLLEVLARFSGRTVPTETLLEKVWGSEYAGEVAHVKHYIWALRRKIEEDPGDPRHILTERGFGYRLE